MLHEHNGVVTPSPQANASAEFLVGNLCASPIDGIHWMCTERTRRVEHFCARGNPGELRIFAH